PGTGNLCHETSPLTISGMVESLRTQLTDRKIDGPLRLVGLSIGGMIATCWLQTYPHEIERLVLINTSMRPFNRPDQRLRPQQYRNILAALLAGSEKREALLQDMSVNLRQQPRETLASWYG